MLWLIRTCFQYEPILAGILGISYIALLIYYPFISGSIKVIKKTFKVPNDGNSLSGGYDEVEFDYEVSIDK